VAYHEAMHLRRRGAVGDKVIKQVAWSRPEENKTTPAEEPLLRFEAVDRVRQALEALPPEQRQIVRMRIYEEKTFAVIAAELDIPLGTALGRMRTALMKLKERLKE
jgi:RNA polymerase sigma-70 factor (ECF subfamily)